MRRARPDYGLDSPGLIAGELITGAAALGIAAGAFALHLSHPLGILLKGLGVAAASYLLVNAGNMIYYSKVGKVRLREQLLDLIPWRGDEEVLDAGCGPGLLAVGAARRVKAGHVVGLDRWVRGAVSGNWPEVMLRNAELEGVADRVAVEEGDVRRLPCADASFDVALSNFVVHEMDSRAERQQMLGEMLRVLRPGGRIAVLDFVFMAEAAHVLRDHGVTDARRGRVGHAYFWVSALLSLGLVRLYAVIGTAPTNTTPSPQTSR